MLLAWIGNFDKIFVRFIQRRVDNIQSKKIVSQWYHIATLQADILSRDAFLPVLEKCGVIVPAFCLFKEI